MTESHAGDVDTAAMLALMSIDDEADALAARALLAFGSDKVSALARDAFVLADQAKSREGGYVFPVSVFKELLRRLLREPDAR